MATQKQIEANRRNAKLSTGPKTAEGKARVSKNAIRHGVWSIHPVVYGLELPQDWEAFEAGIRESLAPVGMLEEALATRVAFCFWRLRRTAIYETWATTEAAEDRGGWNRQTPCPVEATLSEKEQELQERREYMQSMVRNILNNAFHSIDTLAKISSYESHLSRQMFLALHELQRLQFARNGEKAADPLPA